jgi:hypothetical protein
MHTFIQQIINLGQSDESADERSIGILGKELGQSPAPELTSFSRIDRRTEAQDVFHLRCTESKTESGLDDAHGTQFGCAQFLDNV